LLVITAIARKRVRREALVGRSRLRVSSWWSSQACGQGRPASRMRKPMHPADQFDAFQKLADDGQGDETIAAHFGVSGNVVRQRLKLASVSPKLMEQFRTGGIKLEQMMAFTVSDDHKAQERVWAQKRRPSMRYKARFKRAKRAEWRRQIARINAGKIV
jgi:hypothetical protein